LSMEAEFCLVVPEIRSGVCPLPRIYDGRVGNGGHDTTTEALEGRTFRLRSVYFETSTGYVGLESMD
jgi:hypothetical protein